MSRHARASLALFPILILTGLLAPPTALRAQEEEPTRGSAAATPAEQDDAAPADVAAADGADAPAAALAEGPPSSYEIRNRFSSLLRQHPPELATILALDPTLLSNEAFLADYPELTGFLADHPEILRSPHFYLRDSGVHRGGHFLSDLLEMAVIFATFLLIALALAWLVRTVIEQKRWNRLSRTQSEVHNKILDRFGTTEELLEYVRTPAGTKFLESAPIPLREDRPAQEPAVPRVLWSIQIGVIVAAAALGMLLVSFRFDGETGEGLFALGVIGFCLGAGFVGSAAVSGLLARRLGLWEPGDGAGPGPSERPEDSGLVG